MAGKESKIQLRTEISSEPITTEDPVGEICEPTNPFINPISQSVPSSSRRRLGIPRIKMIAPVSQTSTRAPVAPQAPAVPSPIVRAMPIVRPRSIPTPTRILAPRTPSIRAPEVSVSAQAAQAAQAAEAAVAEDRNDRIEQAIREESYLRQNAWNPSGRLKIGDENWILNNSLEFPDFVNRRYHEYRLTRSYTMDCYKREEQDLFEYQKFIKAYISTISPFRGILLYYGLGSGKTRASIEVARQFAQDGDMCLFISKAKLIYNFAKELAKWGWTWKGRVFTQADYEEFNRLSSRNKASGQSFLETFGVGYAAYNAGKNSQCQLERYLNPKTGRLTNMVIIIDEVHNLAQKLHNGLNSGTTKKREDSERYYKMLMDTLNCRFVTLSGTPVINQSSELAILFNLLRGPIPIPPNFVFDPDRPSHTEVQERGYFELFPVWKGTFNHWFVDYDTRQPRNIQIFKQRIQGLVSYYSGAKGQVYPQMVDSEGDPTDRPVIVPVPMSETQTLYYEFVREAERKRDKPKKEVELTEEEALRAGDDEIRGNFRVKSRQASNYGYPLDMLNYLPTGRRKKEDIQNLLELLDENPDEYFGWNLSNYSGKIAAIIERMEYISRFEPQRDGGTLIYSNFREVEGIAIMARALLANGYTEYKPGDELKPGFEFDGRKFAILGSKEGETTQQIIDIYKSLDNLFLPGRQIYRYGEDEEDEEGEEENIPYIGAGRIVKILLGTEMISEGIDLFNIRQVHIMEPHWNFVRIDQTIGRARRICSHMNLPRDLWNFTAWIYLSVLDPEFEHISKDKKTTDQVLFEIAMTKKQINDSFLAAQKSAAVDCSLNSSHNTEITATGRRIECMVLPEPTKNRTHAYYPDLAIDLAAPPPVLERVQVRKSKKILGNYSPQVFPPPRFPDLWISTSQGLENRYLVQHDRAKKIVMDTRPNNVKRIIFYDKELALTTGEEFPIGYMDSDNLRFVRL